MHNVLSTSSIQHFDPAFLEKYAELFAKSLIGKGDQPAQPGPNNSLV
jgi:hypothetical protein